MRTCTPLVLTPADLAPAVAALLGTREVRVSRITFEPGLQTQRGYAADKAVATVEYEEADGRRGTARIFVKWPHAAESAEGQHYEHLQRLGAPVARVLARSVSDGRPLLFLEYLDCASPVEVDDTFVSYMARFNAVAPDQQYLQLLRTRHFGGDLLASKEAVRQVWDTAARGELGGGLRDHCASQPDLQARLCRLAEHLAQDVCDMQTGVLHTDLYPENCGWRQPSRELVVFDLEHVALGPRFYDIARWVGVPPQTPAEGSGQRRLAECFLTTYLQHGGAPATLDSLLAESRQLWATGVLVMLWFALKRAVDGRVDWTGDTVAGRESYRGKLRQRLLLLDRAAIGLLPH